VEGSAGDEVEWPFPCQEQQAKDDVDDLQYRQRLYRRIERLRQPVPEDLWPEEPFYAGTNLICDPELEIEPKRPPPRLLVRLRNLHVAAVRTISLAQWFLISLPILSDFADFR
jgi:hypothetical protein